MSEFVNSELGNWIFGFCYGLGIGALVTDWVKRPR